MMRRRNLVRLLVATALLPACFATNPVDRPPDADWFGPGYSGTYTPPAALVLGEPAVTTPVSPTFTGTVRDIAIDPGGGDVVLLSPGAVVSTLTLVERTTGLVLGGVTAALAIEHLGGVAPGKVLASDGVSNHLELDLTTLTAEPFMGLLEAADHAPYALDADGGDLLAAGGDGEVVTVEAIPCPPSQIGFWTGKGAERRLARSVPLPDVFGISDMAYAQEEGLLFLVTPDGLVLVDAATGELLGIYEGTANWWNQGVSYYADDFDAGGADLAFDAAKNRLVVAIGTASDGDLRIEEYQF